jgi:RNA polymerase sigma factor (sigma-70 family)
VRNNGDACVNWCVMPSVDRASYFQMVQDCEAAISRIRAAIRAGALQTEQVGAEFGFILAACAPKLIGFARRVAGLGALAFEEALEAMQDRLLDDIWSLGYVSLETQFGAYLNSMPLRVIWQIMRKYGGTTASLRVARLDAPLGGEGLPLHASVADPAAAAAFDAIGDQDALAAAITALPPDERRVIALRRAGQDNNAIARQLGVSPATATRIYQRAVVQLRRWLLYEE